MAVGPERGIAFQHRIGTDEGARADVDAPEVQPAALHMGVFQVDRIAYAGAVADGQQRWHAQRDRADQRVVADPGAERAQPVDIERGAGQQIGGRRFGQAVAQPPAEVGQAPERVTAGLQIAGDQAHAGRGHGEGQQGHQQEDAGRGGHRQRDRVARIAGIEVVGEEGRQPLRHAQRHQRRRGDGLRRAAAPAAPGRDAQRRLLHSRRCRGVRLAGGDGRGNA